QRGMSSDVVGVEFDGVHLARTRRRDLRALRVQIAAAPGRARAAAAPPPPPPPPTSCTVRAASVRRRRVPR
ncbi:hypothetical protein, partial [Nocardia asiatica]|uniref:hypothetical protein n=1 Tax=Nocardia asiatica TaxID=209252 RepID=UPI00313EA87D